jgi:hypothetical protein
MITAECQRCLKIAMPATEITNVKIQLQKLEDVVDIVKYL